MKTGYGIMAGFLMLTGLFLCETRAGADSKVPARRLTYRTDSLLIRGRAEVEYSYGPLYRVAKRVPYQSEHEKGRRQFNSMAWREVLALSALVQVRLMPDYYMESYLDPTDLRPFRAVRWKRDFPDVMFDFLNPGILLLTRAEPISPSVRERLGGWFRSESELKFEMLGHHPPMATGDGLVDLMTVLLELEKRFTHGDSPPSQPFYISGIRKGLSSMYVGRFEPVGRERVTLRVNRKRIERWAVKCETTLQYGVPVVITEQHSLERLAAEYMPERTLTNARRVIESILQGRNLPDMVGKAVVLPVSVEVYNRIYDDDKDFSGPFGLSESVTFWIDEKLGIPLRAECQLYGIGGNVLLSEADDDYFKLLQN